MLVSRRYRMDQILWTKMGGNLHLMLSPNQASIPDWHLETIRPPVGLVGEAPKTNHNLGRAVLLIQDSLGRRILCMASSQNLSVSVKYHLTRQMTLGNEARFQLGALWVVPNHHCSMCIRSLPVTRPDSKLQEARLYLMLSHMFPPSQGRSPYNNRNLSLLFPRVYLNRHIQPSRNRRC